jgi:hypothetical protein
MLAEGIPLGEANCNKNYKIFPFAKNENKK